ncbi:methyltransferase domain-containing protein [Actinomadura graeca]|uniref:Protein-L-isoaspartate O-methyltransferase n=1 Tax=Actinomadura graeca TaxID=2750812 RepID=A0ABX8R1G3_9ACTN|nr:methyltransferase domain-containing protein [Actinomadura graeca]QXJ24259.1 methyltransferase domain-containing protein [Actinomadura graeca]
MTGPDVQTDARWKGLLEEVPRDLFVPDIAVVGPVIDDPASWIDRTADPERWWEVVHSDTAIGVQLDDGAIDLVAKTSADPCAVATSSTSAPHLVAAMLDLLDAGPGDRVLEVGTGTGWTAALLAHRVGEGNVVSVEIDAAVAARAAENLQSAGVGAQVVTADGAQGWPAAGPYDRVHVTVGTADIPYAWVEQTRPGGAIVLPWMPGWRSGHLVKLTVADDGTASGRLGEPCGFMLLRGQRRPPNPAEEDVRTSQTETAPREIAEAGEGFQVALAGCLPGVEGGGFANDDGSYRLMARDGRSRALVVHRPGQPVAEVEMTGPRDLWDEIVAVYQRWIEWGRPGKERFGLSSTREGTRVWLDDPAQRLEGP